VIGVDKGNLETEASWPTDDASTQTESSPARNIIIMVDKSMDTASETEVSWNDDDTPYEPVQTKHNMKLDAWVKAMAYAMLISFMVIVPTVVITGKKYTQYKNIAPQAVLHNDGVEHNASSSVTPTTTPTSSRTFAPSLTLAQEGYFGYDPNFGYYDPNFGYNPNETSQCDGHELDSEGELMDVSAIFFSESTLGDPDSDPMDRTFEVEPSHTVLDNKGVIFNVETVDKPHREDLTKDILTSGEIKESVFKEATQFYLNKKEGEHVSAVSLPPNITVEVTSFTGGPLVYAGGQGFLASCMMAFAQHLPLRLAPDHLWAVISQGFAHHVDRHAVDLRYQFVDHEGKMEIRIREDSLAVQSLAMQWEQLIFPKFSQAISENLNNQEVYETLSGRFSTTTATTQAASQIVLMATLKNFFEYSLVTACGIPKIRLDGSREDWVDLRDRAAKLAQWMMPGHTHGEVWIKDIVVPILDQFIDAYDGKVNYCFWQTMVKFRRTGSGSGSFDFLSGWLPTLFPYLSKDGGKTEPNPYLRTWQESVSSLQMGAQPNEIPSQLASVPVKWEFFGGVSNLHFHSGFRGVTQEPDGTLSPVIGWYVTGDPK